jgi:hypothetical protein
MTGRCAAYQLHTLRSGDKHSFTGRRAVPWVLFPVQRLHHPQGGIAHHDGGCGADGHALFVDRLAEVPRGNDVTKLVVGEARQQPGEPAIFSRIS